MLPPGALATALPSASASGGGAEAQDAPARQAVGLLPVGALARLDMGDREIDPLFDVARYRLSSSSWDRLRAVAIVPGGVQ